MAPRELSFKDKALFLDYPNETGIIEAAVNMKSL